MRRYIVSTHLAISILVILGKENSIRRFIDLQKTVPKHNVIQIIANTRFFFRSFVQLCRTEQRQRHCHDLPSGVKCFHLFVSSTDYVNETVNISPTLCPYVMPHE